MSDQPSDCGGKHLKLGLWIIGTVLGICAGTVSICHAMVGGLEVRVRQVEQNDAANAARFEAISEALRRLESKER